MSLLQTLRRLLGLGVKRAEPPTAPTVTEAPIETPAPAPRKPERYFSIGIDFGTHGTKIAYRASDGSFNDTRIITLEGAGTSDRQPNVFPSLVTVRNDRIYFGAPVNGGAVIENLKMKIGDNAVEPHSGLTYEDISVLFLAHVLCSAERIIRSENPDYLCKIMLNLGAPFSQLQADEYGRDSYERILRLVWRLYWHHASEVQQGIQLEEGRKLILAAELNIARGEEDWRWLVPEAQAVVTTFAQSADVPPHSYHLVVDVGGFTTDFSLFNVGDSRNPMASIFTSRVIRRAIIDYDQAQNGDEFCRAIRNELFEAINNTHNETLLEPGQFVNFDRKALWRIGGGYYRSDFLDRLLNPAVFLPGLQQLDRNPEFRGNVDRMFLVARGLATLHRNLIAIVQANPIRVFEPPPDNELPFHLQDHN